MKITGIKRWFVVVLCALMAGIMVYVPFLRYSYYDQMCVLFTQYKQIVPAETVNTFIGDFGMAFGIVSMLGYPFGESSQTASMKNGCLLQVAFSWGYALFGSEQFQVRLPLLSFIYSMEWGPAF